MAIKIARPLLTGLCASALIALTAQIVFPNLNLTPAALPPATGVTLPEISAPMAQSWALSLLRVKEAWKQHLCKQPITVAVIDTGIDTSNPTLKEMIGKKGGWDFVTNTSDPADEHGHGTHVAGIIHATTGGGMKQLDGKPCISLMVLKYYDPAGGGGSNLERSRQALKFAIDSGARIINYSGGGAVQDPEELKILQNAQDKVLIVAAAGNNERNIDEKKGAGYYPASYRLSNTVAVAAVQQNPVRLMESSNYGQNTVDIAAPGHKIFSTLPNHTFGQMTGTSQATAFVSGIAALIWSMHPDLSPQEVKEKILKSAKPLPSLKKKVHTGGLVDAANALN